MFSIFCSWCPCGSSISSEPNEHDVDRARELGNFPLGGEGAPSPIPVPLVPPPFVGLDSPDQGQALANPSSGDRSSDRTFPNSFVIEWLKAQTPGYVPDTPTNERSLSGSSEILFQDEADRDLRNRLDSPMYKSSSSSSSEGENQEAANPVLRMFQAPGNGAVDSDSTERRNVLSGVLIHLQSLDPCPAPPRVLPERPMQPQPQIGGLAITEILSLIPRSAHVAGQGNVQAAPNDSVSTDSDRLTK